MSRPRHCFLLVCRVLGTSCGRRSRRRTLPRSIVSSNPVPLLRYGQDTIKKNVGLSWNHLRMRRSTVRMFVLDENSFASPEKRATSNAHPIMQKRFLRRKRLTEQVLAPSTTHRNAHMSMYRDLLLQIEVWTARMETKARIMTQRAGSTQQNRCKRAYKRLHQKRSTQGNSCQEGTHQILC